jgi:hypothetical protein
MGSNPSVEAVKLQAFREALEKLGYIAPCGASPRPPRPS